MTIDARSAVGKTAPNAWNAGAIPAVFPARAGGDSSSAMRAVFVASRSDCTGNFSLANLVAPRGVHEITGAPELVLQGASADSIGLREILPFALRASAIRFLSEDEKRFLHGIGHHATPVLLLYDRENRLRLASQVDPDPVARVALGRAIRHLTTLDPSY